MQGATEGPVHPPSPTTPQVENAGRNNAPLGDGAPRPQMSFKDKVDAAQKLVAILAILVGALWTYNLFVKERKNYPHANIEQRLSHITLHDANKLLRVGIEVTNTGTSRLILKRGMVRIQQVLPILPCPNNGPCAAAQFNAALSDAERTDDRFSWPTIATRQKEFLRPQDIEPGEKDFLDFEFAVTPAVSVVRVYAWFRNEDKSSSSGQEVGWSSSSLYDVSKP